MKQHPTSQISFFFMKTIEVIPSHPFPLVQIHASDTLKSASNVKISAAATLLQTSTDYQEVTAATSTDCQEVTAATRRCFPR